MLGKSNKNHLESMYATFVTKLAGKERGFANTQKGPAQILKFQIGQEEACL